MMKRDSDRIELVPVALLTASLAGGFAYPVSAQIVPDDSLGAESSVVTPNVTVKETLADLIEGGSVRGNNLFHSFSEFNVENGGRVYFANPDGIANILTRELNLDNSAVLEATVNAGSQGNINLTTDTIFLSNNSEINAKATGTATGGNITINNTDNLVLLDNSEIIADAVEGMGGNINITTQGLFVSPNSKISASSEFGLDGTVEIDELNGDRKLEFDRLPENIVDTTSLIANSCPTNFGNTLAVTGNGGIPNSPYSTQSLNNTWYDLRPIQTEKTNVASLPTPLTEATAAIINAQGEVELIALNPLSNYRWVKSNCSN